MSRMLFALPLLYATALVAGCGKSPEAQAPAPVAVPSLVAASAAPTAAATGTGTVRGLVAFNGKAPEMPILKRDDDPFCAAVEMRGEDVLVNRNGTLRNVFVRLNGISGSFAPPLEPAVIDQVQCMYRPRVQGIVAGQTLHVKNGDKTLHNVHTYRGAKTLFNLAQVAGGPIIEKKFKDSGVIVRFGCDVHPWMIAYVVVSNHPFFAVTGDDGSFELKNVPAGTYKMEAWHEKGATKVADVIVAANGVAEVRFSFHEGELR